ncbi:hypothetical protein, partial [Thiolapillus sp.]
IGCQRPSRFWGLGCPKIYHEAEDTLVQCLRHPPGAIRGYHYGADAPGRPGHGDTQWRSRSRADPAFTRTHGL